jgi:hypothetical protein
LTEIASKIPQQRLGTNVMETSIEYTLALIKPDAVRAGKALEIQQLIEMSGFMIITKKQLQVNAYIKIQNLFR